MANTDTHHGILHRQNRWSAATGSLRAWYANYRRRRRAIAQLRGLDARTLKDIAIDRTELTSIVYGDRHGRRRAANGTDHEILP